MSRYIDADNVMSAFDRVCNDCGMRDTVICDSCKFDGARIIVENTPTEDVKPIVYGEWIDVGLYVYECSNCYNSLEMWWERERLEESEETE